MAAEDITAIRERIQRVEWTQEQQDQRLSQGAGAFSDLRQSIADVREDIHKAHSAFQKAQAPRPIQWWKVAALGVSLASMAVTVIWMLARYPDRGEFVDAQRANSGAHKDLEKDLERLKESQTSINTQQQLIKASQESSDRSLQKIDHKLDKLLTPIQ